MLRRLTFTTAALLSFTASAGSIPLVLNGDFETLASGSPTSHAYLAPHWNKDLSGHYEPTVVRLSAGLEISTPLSGHAALLKGESSAGIHGSIRNLTQGEEYTLLFDYFRDGSHTQKPDLIVGVYPGGIRYKDFNFLNREWFPDSGTTATQGIGAVTFTASAPTASFRARSIAKFNPQSVGGIYLDNFRIQAPTVVPTPAAASLGLLSLGALIIRRRR